MEDVLGQIQPGQKLTAEQQAYLTEMESEQHDMSVDDLKGAQDKLGDHENVIGDSWQLMSNDDVAFGSPDENGNQPKGSFERLPESVQRALSNDNLIGYPGDEVERQKVDAIADIVRNGDAKFQDGTEIDREMIRLSDRLMDESPANQETVRDLFTSAGRDHQVVTDHMVGWQPEIGRFGYDYNSDDFLKDVMTTGWADDGKDAATLFNWTNENATGPNADIASAAAERYATFLGTHPELMDVPSAVPGMTDTLGQVNPDLVKGMAHGLTPYMADIAGVAGGAEDNFEPLGSHTEGADPNKSYAKNVFAILGTDVHAYGEFYGAANELALDKAHEWATAATSDAGVSKDDARMNAAASIKALVDHGTAEGLGAIKSDQGELDAIKRAAYDKGVDLLAAATPGVGKEAVGFFGNALADSFFATPGVEDGVKSPMYAHESARFAANALLGLGADLSGTEGYLVHTDADGNVLPKNAQPVLDPNGQPYQRFGTIAELTVYDKFVTTDVYGAELNAKIDQIVGADRNPSASFGSQYDRLAVITK